MGVWYVCLCVQWQARCYYSLSDKLVKVVELLKAERVWSAQL